MTSLEVAERPAAARRGERLPALTIARFTIQEAVSRRLVLAAFVLSLIFLGLFALGFSFLYGKIAENTRNASPGSLPPIVAAGTALTVLGLYAVYFLSSFLALFLTVGAISGEIDSGTLHAVLARPIRRADVVLGRWLAYSGMIGVYVAVMAGTILLLAGFIAGYQAMDPLRAIALMALAAILLLTVSLFGSTLLSTLANGVVAFTLFGLAWLGGIMEFAGGLVQNDSLVNLGIAVSLLIPSDGLWKAASFYAQTPVFLLFGSAMNVPFSASSPPTWPFLTWALIYPFVFLALAVRAFSRRDL
ncbi:MAG: ABC transporter permease [Chloroflexi bacterium]|nr:ABC transporter permease [Chloroflexota bacterium]